MQQVFVSYWDTGTISVLLQAATIRYEPGSRTDAIFLFIKVAWKKVVIGWSDNLRNGQPCTGNSGPWTPAISYTRHESYQAADAKAQDA